MAREDSGKAYDLSDNLMLNLDEIIWETDRTDLRTTGRDSGNSDGVFVEHYYGTYREVYTFLATAGPDDVMSTKANVECVTYHRMQETHQKR